MVHTLYNLNLRESLYFSNLIIKVDHDFQFFSFEYILKGDLHLLFFSWNMVLHINDLVLLYRYFLKTVSSPTPCHLPYFFAVLCREELAPF